jgi:hypothetical protein
MLRSAVVVALIALLAGSCVGSSVPQPPNLDPVRPGLVSEQDEEAGGLEGAPGAAPPNAEVWGWDLDAAHPPSVVLSDARGAFMLTVPSVVAEELRLQVRRDGERSLPVDIVPRFGGSAPVERPACFQVPLELELDAGGSAVLELRNECGVEANLTAVRLRIGGAFVVQPPPDLRLPSGGTLPIVIDAPAAPDEDIVLVEVVLGATSARYAVTVIAN